jgi:hypothetical protein
MHAHTRTLSHTHTREHARLENEVRRLESDVTNLEHKNVLLRSNIAEKDGELLGAAAGLEQFRKQQELRYASVGRSLLINMGLLYI